MNTYNEGDVYERNVQLPLGGVEQHTLNKIKIIAVYQNTVWISGIRPNELETSRKIQKCDFDNFLKKYKKYESRR